MRSSVVIEPMITTFCCSWRYFKKMRKTLPINILFVGLDAPTKWQFHLVRRVWDRLLADAAFSHRLDTNISKSHRRHNNNGNNFPCRGYRTIAKFSACCAAWLCMQRDLLSCYLLQSSYATVQWSPMCMLTQQISGSVQKPIWKTFNCYCSAPRRFTCIHIFHGRDGLRGT